jgi:hypothetical protein
MVLISTSVGGGGRALSSQQGDDRLFELFLGKIMVQ